MSEYPLDIETLNSLVASIERRYRDERECWGKRIRFIPAPFVRSFTSEFPEGVEVTSELLGYLFYWPVYPLGFDRLRQEEYWRDETCPGCRVTLPAHQMSLDHKKPVSKGGLELDRENIRFVCLPCNLKRGNRTLRLGDGRLENHPPLERWFAP